MSTIQRRFSVFFGAALLAMAFAAPSAFALVDFPHEEEASKWTAVAVYDYNGSISKSEACDNGAAGGADCSFSDSSSCKVVFFGVLITSGCTSSLAGDIGPKGELSTTESKIGETGPYTGLICRHNATREYWVRVESSEGGYMFGYLTADPSGLGGSQPDHPRTLSFGMPGGLTKVQTTGPVGYYGTAFSSMWSEKELLIGPFGSQPCDWPEL